MRQPVVIRWVGGEHPFRLGLGEMRAIQDATGCGPEFLAHRIKSMQWKVDDLREIMRNGLIGGGMDHVQALRLIEQADASATGISLKVPALEVMLAYLYGPADDPVGEPSPAGDQTPQSQKTGDGDSASTTE